MAADPRKGPLEAWPDAAAETLPLERLAELSARISRREYAPDGCDVAKKLLSELLGELLT